MKPFPETSADYARGAFFVVVLWAIGVAVAFIPGDLGKNLSFGVGLGNSLISVLAVILVVGNYARQVELRLKDERREKDSVMQSHYFQVLLRLPDLLPADDVAALRAKSALLSQVLGVYFRESLSLRLNREQILHDLSEH